MFKTTMAALVLASTIGTCNEKAVDNPHQFTFGVARVHPKMSYTSQEYNMWETPYKTTKKMKAPVHGIHLGYDYVSSNSFYFGTDLFSGVTNNEFQDYSMGRIDLRFGYTLPFLVEEESRLDASVFVNTGSLAWMDRREQHYSIQHMGAGFRTNYQTCDVLKIGFTLKANVHQDQRQNNRELFYGFEAGLPVSLTPSGSTWEFVFSPAFHRFYKEKNQHMTGYHLRAVKKF